MGTKSVFLVSIDTIWDASFCAKQEDDSISNAFSCPQLKVVQENTHIQYEDIFSGVQQQKRAVKKFIQLNTTRSALLKADPAYQGLVLDTATPAPAGGARV